MCISVLFKLFFYSEYAFSFFKKNNLFNLTQIHLSCLKFTYKSLCPFRFLQDVQLEILPVSSREMATEYPISGVSELHGEGSFLFSLNSSSPGVPSHPAPVTVTGVLEGWMPKMEKEDEGLCSYVRM